MRGPVIDARHAAVTWRRLWLGRWRVGMIILVVAAVAAATAFGTAAGFGHPRWWALPAFAIAVLVSELSMVTFSVGRQRWSLSLTDSVATAVYVLAPGAWMVLMLPAGVAVAQLIRRQKLEKIVFNTAQFAAATAAGAWTAQLVLSHGLPQLTAAALAMTFFWLIQTPLVAVAVSATTNRSLRELLALGAPVAFVHTAASACVGLLGAWLATTAPVGLIGLLVPLALLWSSFDQTSRRSGEALLFAELARGQERAGGSIDASAQVMLTAAARLLGSAQVELLVFSGEGLARYVGDGDRSPSMQRAGLDALDQSWIAEVLRDGVVLGVADRTPFCHMRVGTADAPVAFIRATREDGAESFTRQDGRLARVLVDQAESWLSTDDPAALERGDGAAADSVTAGGVRDFGVDALPALAALRESSGRLARLARETSDREALDGIVEELHAVERAVAALLGAVAMAGNAQPQPTSVDPSPVAPSVVALPDALVSVGGHRLSRAEWTSSGVVNT